MRWNVEIGVCFHVAGCCPVQHQLVSLPYCILFDVLWIWNHNSINKYIIMNVIFLIANENLLSVFWKAKLKEIHTVHVWLDIFYANIFIISPLVRPYSIITLCKHGLKCIPLTNSWIIIKFWQSVTLGTCPMHQTSKNKSGIVKSLYILMCTSLNF